MNKQLVKKPNDYPEKNDPDYESFKQTVTDVINQEILPKRKIIRFNQTIISLIPGLFALSELTYIKKWINDNHTVSDTEVLKTIGLAFVVLIFVSLIIKGYKLLCEAKIRYLTHIIGTHEILFQQYYNDPLQLERKQSNGQD